MNFICMRIVFINDFVFNLAFRQRIEATRKWSILSQFVYCNAFTQFVPSSLLSTHYVPNVSLNISFKIWPTSESLRFSKNQHSAVEKTVRGFTKSDLFKVIYLLFFIIHLMSQIAQSIIVTSFMLFFFLYFFAVYAIA